MKIVYDVTAVAQMTAACRNANNELQKAQNLLQEIKSHNDWGCKEKNTINDLVGEAKKMIKRLCENQDSFFQAVKAAEGELTGAEKSVSGLFNGVESLLGKILSIPVKETIVIGTGLGKGSALWEKIFDGGGSGGSSLADEQANSRTTKEWIEMTVGRQTPQVVKITEPVQIVNFDSLTV